MTKLFETELKGERLVVALLFFVGVLQIAGYYLAGALVNGEGPLAAPQPDTLLYCQAARRIAEGSPFSYSAGTAMSTGTTSVLYPFVLSFPYLLGARGDALFVAGFALNAFFYIVFLFGWSRVFSILCEGRTLRLSAITLLALSPQPAYCALSQSDTGIWLAVSGLFFAALFSGNASVCVALLVLGPWIRPEGMILVVAYCLYAVLVRRKADMVAALAGLASSAGVFALNFLLTGKAQFSSVANKGYFTSCPLPWAVYMTAADMLRLLKEFVFGLANTPPRMFFVIPLFGAVCIMYGVIRHAWSNEKGRKLGLASLAAFGGFAVVSMSGWQNTNMDRYLAWTFPLVVLFLSEGVFALASRIESGVARRVVASLPAVYAAGASLVMFFVFNGNSKDTSLIQEFGKQCELLMPSGASVGCLAYGSLAYEFSDRRFAHLSGIYSPEFLSREPLSVLEVLKHEPQHRFDYWVLTPNAELWWDIRSHLGEQVLAGPVGLELRKSDWGIFSNAAKVPNVEGLSLAARVDVGYEPDELASGYEVVQRNGDRVFAPVLRVAEGSGGKMVEVARMIAGYDEMSVPLAPGRDVCVMMRTFGSCDVVSRGAFVSGSVTYEIANPAKLNISVDGQVATCVEFSCGTNMISDVKFFVPGSAIKTARPRIAFLGDHIACAYWFYQ